MMQFHVMWLSWPVIAIVAGTVLQWIVSEILLFKNHQLNVKSSNKQSYDRIVESHPLIERFLSFEKYTQTNDYSNANYSFHCTSRAASQVISALMFAFCCWPHAIAWIQQYEMFAESMLLTLLVLSVGFSLVFTLVEIPFDLYGTFKIEEKFGFNRQTMKSWFSDLIKSSVVSTVMTCADISAAYYAVTTLAMFCDITSMKYISIAVASMIVTSFAYEWLYINVIAKIFNKFTPLEDKDLERHIKDMISAAGFSVSGIYVMDAGKRSKHGNAYFCGWGKSKRIVLYDVLLEKHTREEIIAILSHEVGHLVHHDMIKSRVQSMLFMTAEIFIVVHLATNLAFYHAFGFSMVTAENIVQWYLVGFSLASLLIESITWLLDPLSSWLSRREEYAADAYAAEHADSEAMKTALVKLSADNLSNFNVHPWYEWWFYDHPSLSNRLRNLSK